MLAKLLSCALMGLDGELVQVEVDTANGLPAFTIVGLPDTAVQEARERVRAAIRNSGRSFPQKRITVNLAPADLRKEGPAYDLPIAIGVLAASEQIPPNFDRSAFFGELALDGSVRHVQGILPMVALARERGVRRVYVPEADAREAALVDGIEVLAVSDLRSIADHFTGAAPLAPAEANRPSAERAERLWESVDFADVRGQEHVKRAVEVAAAGGHNALMSGPPGAGKTLLARALPTIMPDLTIGEALEVTKIYSVGGMLPPETPLVTQRPFRAPHHTISSAGLVGGGGKPRPGEISLAHHGVLFLDELPEFGQALLETLRQPLEDRIVTISRASFTATYPANFTLIGAMNPCPCGYLGDTARPCTCTSGAVQRYQRRISGPLLDRIDIFVEVPRVDYEKLAGPEAAEPSVSIRRRVETARRRQRERLAATGSRSVCNAQMTAVEVREHCQTKLDEGAGALLRMAMTQLSLSGRAFHRTLKLARTIADLAGSDVIAAEHLAEAIQYRRRGVGA